MASPVAGQITGSSVVRRSDNHFSTDHDGAMIIMSVEAGKFFTFNDVGFEIWHAFADLRRVDDVVDELAARHGAPRERVEKDVIAFLDRLAGEELLEGA